MKVKPRISIGIDTGVNTGVAIFDVVKGELIMVDTMTIHKALFYVLEQMKTYGSENIYVRVEDARKRKWYGNAGKEQLQGAGSIKRDAKIWEDFLLDYQIPHEMVAPRNNKTKLNVQSFSKITGWDKRTNNHARDAAMLVYNLESYYV